MRGHVDGVSHIQKLNHVIVTQLTMSQNWKEMLVGDAPEGKSWERKRTIRTSSCGYSGLKNSGCWQADWWVTVAELYSEFLSWLRNSFQRHSPSQGKRLFFSFLSLALQETVSFLVCTSNTVSDFPKVCIPNNQAVWGRYCKIPEWETVDLSDNFLRITVMFLQISSYIIQVTEKKIKIDAIKGENSCIQFCLVTAAGNVITTQAQHPEFWGKVPVD